MKIVNKGSIAQLIRVHGGSHTLNPGKTIEVEKKNLVIDLEDSDAVQHYADRGVFFEGVKPGSDPFKENEARLKAREEREAKAAEANKERIEREAKEAENQRLADEKVAKETEEKKKSEEKANAGSTGPGRGGNAAAKG